MAGAGAVLARLNVGLLPERRNRKRGKINALQRHLAFENYSQGH